MSTYRALERIPVCPKYVRAISDSTRVEFMLHTTSAMLASNKTGKQTMMLLFDAVATPSICSGSSRGTVMIIVCVAMVTLCTTTVIMATGAGVDYSEGINAQGNYYRSCMYCLCSRHCQECSLVVAVILHLSL
jgi:hypothetical protein